MHSELLRWLGKKQTPLGSESRWWVTIFVTIPDTAGAVTRGIMGHWSHPGDIIVNTGDMWHRGLQCTVCLCHIVIILSSGCSPDPPDIMSSCVCQETIVVECRWFTLSTLFEYADKKLVVIIKIWWISISYLQWRIKCGFCVSFLCVKVGPRPL